MREIRMHDTRSGELLSLRADASRPVGIYACGPTVYSRIHVGNARPFVLFSLLKRFLEHEGLAVRLAINVTDVNDKIYQAASAAGVASAELAGEMTRAYLADTSALGLGRPDHEPLASQYMDAIISYIQALIDSGHAYPAPYPRSGERAEAAAQRAAAGGPCDVFFRVRSDPAYGSLSHRRLEDMDQGEGLEGSERKHDPLDFALWKARKPGEDTWWASPWGDGRPGWHIECSAMAEALLGAGLDIHAGGSDLVFPHHENEAAQTRAARGRELAAIWMHNGMIQSTGEKMAKSAGNIAPLHEVLAGHGREAVIMYLVGGHYRQPLAYSERALAQARGNVNRIREAARRLVPGPSPPELAHWREEFFDALAEDFNTARALGAMNGWIRAASGEATDGPVGDGDLREMLATLGVEGLLAAAPEPPPPVRELAAERERARLAGDFRAADGLRDRLRGLGWEVRDGPDGPQLVPIP